MQQGSSLQPAGAPAGLEHVSRPGPGLGVLGMVGRKEEVLSCLSLCFPTASLAAFQGLLQALPASAQCALILLHCFPSLKCPSGLCMLHLLSSFHRPSHKSVFFYKVSNS